ncbi:MAG: SUMF1/EgtB/PvdO family nonheme iron enzyme [Planctomycetaceae bacterium]
MHERDLLIAAFEIDDETARQAYLDEACVGDPALRERVERLLNRAGEAGDFLEQPATDLCSDLAAVLPADPNEPRPAGDSPMITGQVGDTGQTILLRPAAPPIESASARLIEPAPSGLSAAASPFGTLFGRYRVERVLGSGGMGVVYLAEDLRLGRRVALKIPKFDLDDKFQLIERFRREARTMASVLHRNLCPIFDVDEQNGTHYLTMAFIDGESLAQVIKREQTAGTELSDRGVSGRALAAGSGDSKPAASAVPLTGRIFTPRQIADLIRKLALALDEAHRAGVIHRDLKPANVMIDRTGEPILMDFGLAWMAHEADARVTQSGAIVGTPAYMSPEQAEADHEKVGTASDIYSLGAILYVLLAGQPIHSGGVTRVLFKLIHEAPIRPSEIRGDVDPQLEAICWKAIARRPADRFATAADFAEALARFIAGECIDPLTRSVSEGEGEDDTALVTPGRVKRPPSLTLRVSEPDQTDVLPPDMSADTIAYQTAGVRGRAPSGSPSSMVPRGKSRIVLASLFLIGMIGFVWAIVANRETPKPNEVALNPKEEARLAAKSPAGTQQETVADPEPSANFAEEMLTSSDWEWTNPENLGPAVNTAGPETSPHFSADGKRLWFERGIAAKKDRAWIAERETPDKPWNPAKSIGSAFEFSGPMADMFISRDERTWIFVTWKARNFSQQLYESTRPSPQADWLPPQFLAAAGVPAQFPVLSNDGLTLLLSNGRQGDGLYSLSRPDTNAPWSDPIRVPGPVNSGEGVRATWLSKDGRVLLFHSVHGHGGGTKEFNLWLTTRPSTAEPWQEPVRFGPIVSSSANEIGACLSDDGRELIFASDRSGGSGDFDLYVSRRVRKPAASPHQADFALEFDGKSTYVLIPTLKRDQTEPVTIEAWVEAIEPKASTMMVTLGGKAYCSLNVGKKNWFANDPTLQGFLESPTTTGLVHLAFVADDQEGRLFLNGKLVDRRPRTKGPVDVEETHAWLGAGLHKGSPNYYFQGRLHELSIAKFARYDQDFKPAQRFVADQHTLALYHFDEGSGTKLKDSSGNGHHGQIVGAKWVKQGEWPLVNGKDLTGWGRPQGNGKWEVKDGMLVCSVEKGGRGLLTFVGRDFENFQLHAEVRLRGPGHGGLYFGSRVPNAYRYQVEISPSNSKISSGSLAQAGDWKWLAMKQHSLAPDGEWFDLDVLANGPQLDSKVNGQLIGSISNTATNQVKALTLELDGRLGSVVIEFRKLEIRELVSKPAANVPPPAKASFDAQQARAHQEAWAKHLGTTVETTNSVGAKMILIPPGEFLMGAPDDDPHAQPQEKPQHKVRLTKPFFIGTTEVTVGEFRQFVNATKYITQAESDGLGVFDVNTKQRKPAFWNGFNNPDDWPVNNVSWEDARRFCEWLSQEEHRTYRLPTDAEWEFACRAGTTTKYSFGEVFDATKASSQDKSGKAAFGPVRRFPANPFGLYDMHGSLHEMCWDAGRAYTPDAVVDPLGELDPRHPAVVRGGSHGSPRERLRSSQRYVTDSRIFPEKDFATALKGFRVVALVKSTEPMSVAPKATRAKAAAGPVLPPPLNPADSGLTIHDPQWKLIQVVKPEGKVFSTRFDRQGRLYFAMPERLDDKSPPPGLYRVQPDGTHQAVVQNTDWEFAFSPDEQRCFVHRGTLGMIAEVDLKSGMSIREVDMSPSDDGPTSPHFAPTWYRGSLVKPNEYLLADFGGTKRGPPSTGGIWKFGSDMAAPQRLLTMPEGPARVHALAFGRDELFVAKFSGASSSLATFDGQRLVDRPTEPLPSIGNMVFDPGDGSLLVSEFNGHAILRIDLAQPDRPASVKPLVSGFRRLNFGVMSLTQDGRRLAVVDFDANTIYVLDRSARDVSAAPLKLDPAALLPAALLRSVTSATGLKLGDLDGDGDLDLFVAMLKAPCVMLRNDGKGNFTDSGQQLGDNASFALALGDLDGDGDRDAFVCNSDDQEDAIWLNDGRGLFQRSVQSFPPSSSNDVALADVDGDKDLDVVLSNWKGSVEIWINDGAGKFANRQNIPRIGNTGVALGDLDGDGDADLVMTCIGGDNRVYLNDARGHFTDSEQSLELDEGTSVALGDLDRDGDLDLFLTGNRGNRVWFNDGHARFKPSEQLLGSGKCEAVELVDLDADHDLDAVAIAGGWSDSGPRFTWQNDGRGRFTKGPALATGNSQSLAVGDLDGDGDADVVFGNLSQSAEVWLNQSNQSTVP